MAQFQYHQSSLAPHYSRSVFLLVNLFMLVALQKKESQSQQMAIRDSDGAKKGDITMF